MQTIERFKNFETDDIYVGPTTTRATAKTTLATDYYTGQSSSWSLVWSLVDRSSPLYNTDTLKNLYHSFGIAREDDDTWWKSFEIIDNINAGKMAIAYIPQSECGTYIEGSTIQIRVPTGTGTSEYVTFFGASWQGYADPVTGYEVSADYNPDSRQNGSAAVYLFRSAPYTGTINGGQVHPNSGLSSWTAANVNNEANYPHLRATVVGRGDNGNDVPEGIALLEKGIVCIFDNLNAGLTFVSTNMVGGTAPIWSGNIATTWVAQTITGTTRIQNANPANMNKIIFTGTNADSNSKLYYRPVTVQHKTIYFCHAGQQEFNSTSNHTYDHRKAYFRPDEADSVYITEVGLYNDDNELVAYGKLSEPVRKDKLETLTIKVELVI